MLKAVKLEVKHGDETVWQAPEEGEEAKPMPELAELIFDNTYTATGSLEIDGLKNLDGRPIKDKEFEFAIIELIDGERAKDENGNIRYAATGVSDKDGNITFTKIAYSLEFDLEEYLKSGKKVYKCNDCGEHIYDVVEVENGIQGITYDTVIWKLRTVVTDNGDGELSVAKEIFLPTNE